jgi:uncharacterized membrane protein
MGATASRIGAWSGPLMTILATLAVAVAAYLAMVKWSGGAPACAVLAGCDTVNSSRYSEILGVPVAAFGMLGSAATLAGSLLWWRRADRRGLLVAYLLGLLSLPMLVWLTYLELAVIHAVCLWCVTYAVLVIAGWVVSVAALRARDRGEQA